MFFMTFQQRFLKKKAALLRDKHINAYNRKLFQEFFNWEEVKLKRQNGLSHLDEANYKTLLINPMFYKVFGTTS